MEAYCYKCKRTFSATEMACYDMYTKGKCPDCGNPVKIIVEEVKQDMELTKEQVEEIEFAETWNDDAPRCETHCQNYGTLMCRLDGCITFGYPQYGCKVCPLYSRFDHFGED